MNETWNAQCFRVKVFEEKLNGYSKEVEAFRKKEVSSLHIKSQFQYHCPWCVHFLIQIMAIDEMTKNVEKLDEIEISLTSAREELEVYN